MTGRPLRLSRCECKTCEVRETVPRIYAGDPVPPCWFCGKPYDRHWSQTTGTVRPGRGNGETGVTVLEHFGEMEMSELLREWFEADQAEEET